MPWILGVAWEEERRHLHVPSAQVSGAPQLSEIAELPLCKLQVLSAEPGAGLAFPSQALSLQREGLAEEGEQLLFVLEEEAGLCGSCQPPLLLPGAPGPGQGIRRIMKEQPEAMGSCAG